MKAAFKYLRLDARDKRLVRAAFWALLAAKARLVFGSFERLRLKLEQTPAEVSGSLAEAARVAWAVEAVSRRLPMTDNCLVRAVATLSMLRRRGLPAELRLGVAREAGREFEAHAWVECEGEILIGGEEADRFTRLQRSDRAAETVAG
ncbi:MAG: hypothetical protein ACI8QF_004793 [Limisphaerales bacterium]|jgi:hypothetical protein